QSGYLKMIKTVSLFTFPLMFGLFALAPEFIRFVYGVKWMPAVMLIRVFCVCSIVQSLTSTAGTIFLSQGRSDIQFKVGFFGALAATASIAIGLKWGILGVAVCYTAFSIL